MFRQAGHFGKIAYFAPRPHETVHTVMQHAYRSFTSVPQQVASHLEIHKFMQTQLALPGRRQLRAITLYATFIQCTQAQQTCVRQIYMYV